ncbi:MAG: sigma-70 family RNA polymerase sigma factor [Clostridia bacterium]|nr:sigma-70 family RNA polymerase sigma factor [Clostridia bacterium]
MHATGNSTVEFEDLLQEARLAFLEHIRKVEDEGQVCACFYDILQAMHRHCAEMAPVHIPINRFNQEVGKYTTVPLDVLDNVESTDDFEHGVECRLMIDGFLDSLPETDRMIVASKMQGRKG